MDNTITLLRLEWPCSTGIYSVMEGDECSVAHTVFAEDAPNHKAPQHDKKLSRNARHQNVNLSDYWYAFKNVGQLRRWVSSDEWLEGLHNAGVVVSEYVCDKGSVVVGSYQCCFSASVSRDVFSIAEYFDVSDS